MIKQLCCLLTYLEHSKFAELCEVPTGGAFDGKTGNFVGNFTKILLKISNAPGFAWRGGVKMGVLEFDWCINLLSTSAVYRFFVSLLQMFIKLWKSQRSGQNLWVYVGLLLYGNQYCLFYNKKKKILFSWSMRNPRCGELSRLSACPG